MNILASIRREERKLEQQLGKIQGQLEGLRTAARALGNSGAKAAERTRKLSAAGRAAISRAAKKRWAKVKAQAKKAVS
jgi:hypothetical protein